MKKFSLDEIKSRVIQIKIAEKLKNGELMLYPTDTVAGVGCIGSKAVSVEKLFNIKERDLNKPVSFAFSSIEMLRKYVEIDHNFEPLLSLLPGSLTLILPYKEGVEKLFGTDGKTIGVKILDFPELSSIIELVGEPIITTSANISSEPTARTLKELPQTFLDQMDIIIPWDIILKSHASTVVSCIDEAKIIREGAISKAEILSLLAG